MRAQSGNGDRSLLRLDTSVSSRVSPNSGLLAPGVYTDHFHLGSNGRVCAFVGHRLHLSDPIAHLDGYHFSCYTFAPASHLGSHHLDTALPVTVCIHFSTVPFFVSKTNKLLYQSLIIKHWGVTVFLGCFAFTYLQLNDSPMKDSTFCHTNRAIQRQVDCLIIIDCVLEGSIGPNWMPGQLYPIGCNVN